MAYDTVTQHSKLYPYTSIMASPYSCDPTGVIDCVAAIEQIKANQSNTGVIYVPHGVFLVDTNLTIPAGMALFFEIGASFSVSAGKTLTINGTVIAGPYQIFSGAGTITIASATNTIIPGEWTGSTGTSLYGTITLPAFAGAGGYVKNSATGVLSGNNTIGTGDIDPATTSSQGIAELATAGECQAGVDTERIVTPSGLASVTSSETRAGLVEKATDAEALAKSDTDRYITPAHLALFGLGNAIQTVYTLYNTYTSTASNIPYDATIPQITEGTEFFTVAITPTNAASVLVIRAWVSGCITTGYGSAALFQDAIANALVASQYGAGLASVLGAIHLTHVMVAGTVAGITFRIRAGSSAGSFYINGGSTTRMYGGVMNSGIIVTEYTP